MRSLTASVLSAWVLAASPAWAGQGWYLLIPPVREAPTDPVSQRQLLKALELDKHELDNSKLTFQQRKLRRHYQLLKAFDTHQPLSKWDHGGAFDSAMACEATRIHGMSHADSEPLRIQFGLGRCVASDDPRLR